jgi:hypothetical protein
MNSKVIRIILNDPARLLQASWLGLGFGWLGLGIGRLVHGRGLEPRSPAILDLSQRTFVLAPAISAIMM